MLIVQNHQQQKDRILSLIKARGPSLPVQIAKGIGVESLFAGAFLSELYAEKKIKISDMKVGSSPLYYLEGQEEQLEKFVEHLNAREKEAFFVLKREKVLEDNSLEPVVRVALRAIKDFAIPVKIKMNDDSKLFWKYFLLSDVEMKDALNTKIFGVSIERKEEKVEQKVVEKIIENEIKVEKKASEAEEQKELDEKVAKKIKKEKSGEKKEKTKIIAKIKNKEESIQDNEFGKRIKNYLFSKDIEILDVLLDKRTEFIAKTRLDMLFGKQEFLLFAKDKKSVNDSDLMSAVQKAQIEKMPALFVSFGGLNKKGEEYLKEWRNLIKFEKIKN